VGRLQSLFPTHQFDVIIGSLLGDARLECRSIGLRSPITARLRVHHGAKQKEYVFWKYETFKNLVVQGPKEISWDNPKRNLREISWYFHTKSLEEFGTLHGHFYKNGVKVLPEDIFAMLTPRMLAVWFMDDGANTGEGLTLSTHSFSFKEQVRVTEYLDGRYKIPATIVKDRNKFKIGIGKNGRTHFISVIRPFIIPSMIYKIDDPRNDLIAKSDRSMALGSSMPC
jgi:LAGLIDADG DNA endonuclease family